MTAGPGVGASIDGAALDARFRQIDDHYSKAAADTRRLVQQALDAMKGAPSASDVAQLKAAVSRLEAQVTRLTTATTRTEGALTGLTARIESVERSQVEQAARQAAAASPPPPHAARQPDAARPADPVEAAFAEALEALNGPRHDPEPLRRWVELHPTHPRAPEGYLQLGFRMLDSHYPVAASYYFKRLIADYPMSLQASEARSVLSTLALPQAPRLPAGARKPANLSRKTARRTQASKAPALSARSPGLPAGPEGLPSASTPRAEPGAPSGSGITGRTEAPPPVTLPRVRGNSPASTSPTQPGVDDTSGEARVTVPPATASPPGPPLRPAGPGTTGGAGKP